MHGSIRYMLMDKRWVASQIQLIIMDFQDGKIITLFLNETEDDTIDPALKQFIRAHLHLIQSNQWKHLMYSLYNSESDSKC